MSADGPLIKSDEKQMEAESEYNKPKIMDSID